MVYVFQRSDYKISIFFFQKFTKQSTFNSKDRYVLVFVKISYYHKNMPYILLIWAKYHQNPKPVTLSFLTSYGYRSVLAKIFFLVEMNQ